MNLDNFFIYTYFAVDAWISQNFTIVEVNGFLHPVGCPRVRLAWRLQFDIEVVINMT